MRKNYVVLFFVLLAFVACDQRITRSELKLGPVELPQTADGAGGIPDPSAEYGILADMDGDGVEEWVLVFFEGTQEIIDHYAIVLYTKKDGGYVRSDWLDSLDPLMPAYFKELTPDLPPNPENLPESLKYFPYPRGQDWKGGALNLWNANPASALPLAQVDKKPGFEVLIPMTGFDQWRITFLSLSKGQLQIIGDVEGLEFSGEFGGSTVWTGRKTGGAGLPVSESQWYTEYRLDETGLLKSVEPLSPDVQKVLFDLKKSVLEKTRKFSALEELAWFHKLYLGVVPQELLIEWSLLVDGLDQEKLLVLSGSLQ